MANWETIVLTILLYTLLLCSVSQSQFTTICDNNTEITLFARDNVSYIESYNYPNNYDGSYGDCKIHITTNDSNYIELRVIGYIRRTSDNPLIVYQGSSKDQLLSSKTLTIDKTYKSKSNSLYVQHWSFGSLNDAFRIEYSSEEDDEGGGDDDNIAWIAGPVAGVVIIIVCLGRCSSRGKRNSRSAPQHPQPPPPPPPAASAPAQNATETTGPASDPQTGSTVPTAPSLPQNNVTNMDAPPSYEEAINFPREENKSRLTQLQAYPVPPPYSHIKGETAGHSHTTLTNIQTANENPYHLDIGTGDRLTPVSDYNSAQIPDTRLYRSEVDNADRDPVEGLGPVVLDIEDNLDDQSTAESKNV